MHDQPIPGRPERGSSETNATTDLRDQGVVLIQVLTLHPVHLRLGRIVQFRGRRPLRAGRSRPRRARPAVRQRGGAAADPGSAALQRDRHGGGLAMTDPCGGREIVVEHFALGSAATDRQARSIQVKSTTASRPTQIR